MENKEVRRLNLLALAKQFGSLRALADAVETPPAYLSQIKNQANDRTMGDEIARRFEEKLGKPRGWMDALLVAPDGTVTAIELKRPELTPQHELLIELWGQLTPRQRENQLQQIQAQVAENQQLYSELSHLKSPLIEPAIAQDDEERRSPRNPGKKARKPGRFDREVVDKPIKFGTRSPSTRSPSTKSPGKKKAG